MPIAGAIDDLRACLRMPGGGWAVRGKGDADFTQGPTLEAAIAAWQAKRIPPMPLPLPLPLPLPRIG